MDAIAQTHRAVPAMRAVMSRVQAAIAQRGAHAARTVVLLPYIHLLADARAEWARLQPSGFVPRFETTMTWVAWDVFEPAADSLSMDMAHDLLLARSWLERAGLGARADLLSARLVEAARQLAAVVAAIAPADRAAWAAKGARAAAAQLDAPALALEAALARIAVEWAAASTYATDSLLEADALEDLDLLVVVRGMQHDALASALTARHVDRTVVVDFENGADLGNIRLHQAQDPSDEAERAAACVIGHIDAGRSPVALAAIDRVLTRRVRAMLGSRGVAVRDETGWKLSTTRAAASVMLALRGAAWNATTDAVIDWLKNAPVLASWQVLALERRVRRLGVREWRSLGANDVAESLRPAFAQVQAWREAMAGARAISAWLAALRDVLKSTGQWPELARDAAGAAAVSLLRLVEDDAGWDNMPLASRRWDLASFTAWANEILESASFAPEPEAHEQVVILPLNQLQGRDVRALVAAGCDELRLNPSPDPDGLWTPAQREMLGLPSRETLETQLRAAWAQALQVPECDVLWRRTDDNGEPVLPSPLVQALRIERGLALSADVLVPMTVSAAPTQRPQPTGELLVVTQVSASSYEDLRRCPYRFFAMRQLGLQEADELDADIDKRDFGNWLHQVLRGFHESLRARPLSDGEDRSARLDEQAREVTAAQRFHEGEFLPFAAAWPQVRDGYLRWLLGHEAREQAVFDESEGERKVQLGSVQLVGRIDRIDRLADGRVMVMDYKTEGDSKSRKRVSQPGEDTQLAFYAALLHDDTLRAAYVNVGERGETKTIEQKDIVRARDVLVGGIMDELGRIESGTALPALGEGMVCEFCAARGLCRRDFWS